MVDRIALFAPYTEHVGTERVMLNLADYFVDEGITVDLLRTYHEWPNEEEVAGSIVDMSSRWSSAGIDTLPFPWKKIFLGSVVLPRLSGYLRREKPDVLISGLFTAVVIGARELARVDTKIVASVQGLPQYDRIRTTLWPRVYPRADAVVVPVESIAERTADIADVPPGDVRVIPNPVITEEIYRQGQRQPDHPWFDSEVPVVVAVGRQTAQKDFETLLRAFARLRKEREVRLIIPGKEDEQTELLKTLVEKLGIGDSICFPGFVDNPYAYMRAADVFVLSSAWEGPGHVLIEALALGTPVVATDCPAGPREILRDGTVGDLVPVGDEGAMAEAIGELLDDLERRATYAERGPGAARPFEAERAAAAYLHLCKRLVHPGEPMA